MLAITKVGFVFLLVILLVRRKCPLGLAMVAGAAILGVWSRMPGLDVLRAFVSASIGRASLELMGILILIIVLSFVLKETGQITRIVSSFKSLIANARVLMATLSALIGLLPMLGGALFSAPLVEGAGQGLGLSSQKKVLINYWFRHIWEYSWPLYPGIILAAKLVKMDLVRLISIQLPLTIAAIFAGCIFVLRDIPSDLQRVVRQDRHLNRAKMLLDISPILLVVFLVLVLRVHLILALTISILAAFLINKVNVKRALRMIGKGISWQMILVVIGVMAFKSILEASGAISSITGLLSEYNISPLILMVTLPFLVGFLTGITLGPVGIVWPLLLPFFLTSNGLAYIVLAFASGFAGVLFSPVHLCLILTKDYFRADMGKVYSGLVLPVGFVMLVAFGLFLAYGGSTGIPPS